MLTVPWLLRVWASSLGAFGWGLYALHALRMTEASSLNHSNSCAASGRNTAAFPCVLSSEGAKLLKHKPGRRYAISSALKQL